MFFLRASAQQVRCLLFYVFMSICLRLINAAVICCVWSHLSELSVKRECELRADGETADGSSKKKKNKTQISFKKRAAFN